MFLSNYNYYAKHFYNYMQATETMIIKLFMYNNLQTVLTAMCLFITW